MNYVETIEFLYGLQFFGLKFGLENTRKLAALSGHPENDLRFIHLAGTNGKGSTAAMLESIYRTAGLKVGLFTSPHLVRFNERIQINRQPIPDDDLVRQITAFQPLLAQFPREHHPTFFEVVTVLALRHFQAHHCDLVIWETGMGGRLDATNIVTPLVSVITNVEFDHEKWLGESIEKIAAEKAGIIKPGVPVVTAAERPDALKVIGETAHAAGAALIGVTEEEARRGLLQNLQLPLPGQHQRLNAALALATVRVLQAQFPVPEETIRRGLRSVRWVGRFQVVQRTRQTIILDGAHNPNSAQVLKKTFREHFPNREPVLILGILKDKNWWEICRILAPMARQIHLLPVTSNRTADPTELENACREANPGAAIHHSQNLAEALEKTVAESLLLITGSLYLVGEALDQLQLSPSIGPRESGLNEWFSELK